MPSPRTPVVALALAVAAAAAPGCVERKLVVRSDPPGAVVYLEGEPVDGKTPVEVPFEFDGIRRVTVDAPGYRRLETTANLEARWYDWFPLDVFAEFLWPGTIRDVRTFDYKLEPYVSMETHLTAEQRADLRLRMEELRGRAEQYRAGGNQGPVKTAPAAAPPAPAPAEAPATPPKDEGAEKRPPLPPPPPKREK